MERDIEEAIAGVAGVFQQNELTAKHREREERMGGLNTYFDFAENDFRFMQDAYEHGIKGTSMAALGQSISERYLKHVISEYARPQDIAGRREKAETMETHLLAPLINYIKQDMRAALPKDVEMPARSMDAFYFSTERPGKNSFLPSEDDIEWAYEATKTVREYTVGYIEERKGNRICKGEKGKDKEK